MEKRLILAIVLSFLVLMGYQYLFVKPKQARLKPPVTAAAPAPEAPLPAAAAPAPAPAAAKPEAAPALPPQDLAAVAGQSEKDVVVDTPLYRAVWSNKGAVLKSWTLKKYQTSRKKDQKDLEMVPALAAELGRYPFSVGLDDAALAGQINAALFETSAPGLDLAEGAKGEIRFVYSDGASVKVEKTFGFAGGTYVMTTEVKVWKAGQPVAAWSLWGPGIGNMTIEEAKQSYSAVRGSAVYTGGKVVRMNERKFKAGQNSYGSVDWAAYDENYFTALFLLAPQRGQAAFQQEPGQAAAGPVTAYFLYVTQPAEAFIGPKESLALKAFGHGATKVINYGMFGFIAEILLVATRYFHTLIPNWGVAIILLTILLKILFFPLTYSSTKSMTKMAEIQPKVRALQAKYKKAKTDIEQRQAMNEELMRLYKENGVNPAGGCLPLLIQLPVFWGVFRMLVAAVEFRHAPFALWITDLSVKDPTYITPILMGVTQFISQKMTPSTAPPSQAKMMLAMPFVMTIFFINFQSGLVLYWLTTNVLQIIQQAIMNDMMKKAKPKTAKAR